MCPTLAIVRRFGERLAARDRELRSRTGARSWRRCVRRFGLLIGSDAGIGVGARASLLDEIEEFVAAGIPRPEALRLATAGAAEFLGQEGEFGVVAPGARADLLLLNGDPAEDLAALEAPAGIMWGGRWYREPVVASRRSLPGEGVTPQQSRYPLARQSAQERPPRDDRHDGERDPQPHSSRTGFPSANIAA